jgi:uncharacterized membrane protein YuzA (DUF378 family)
MQYKYETSYILATLLLIVLTCASLLVGVINFNVTEALAGDEHA